MQIKNGIYSFLGNQPNCWNSLCLETLRLLEVVSTNLRGEITRKEQAKVQQKITITQPSQQGQANTVGMQSLFSPGHPSTAIRQSMLGSLFETYQKQMTRVFSNSKYSEKY